MMTSDDAVPESPSNAARFGRFGDELQHLLGSGGRGVWARIGSHGAVLTVKPLGDVVVVRPLHWCAGQGDRDGSPRIRAAMTR